MNKSVCLFVLTGAIVIGVFLLVRCQGGGLAGAPNAGASTQDANQQSEAAVDTETPFGPEQLLVSARVVVLDHAGVGTAEGDGLLELARASSGQAMSADAMKTFSADLSALEGRGQARVLSSPTMMVLSRQSAGMTIGSVGATSGSALNLALDVNCTAEPDGSVSGVFDLRVDLQSGPLELKLAALGLPVGDRAVIHLDCSAGSGQTLLGVRDLLPGNDLGAAMILLVSPRIVPPAPAGPDSAEPETAEPSSGSGQPQDSDG